MFYIKDLACRSLRHRRSTNQDRCFYMNCDGMPDMKTKMSILAVLDGVSHSNGEQAAQMAAAAMRPVLAELLGRAEDLIFLDDESREGEIHRYLCNAIRAADRRLREAQSADVEYGTTVTLVVLFDEAIYAANVGDSPAYLIRVALNGEASPPIPLFQCHNLAGEAVRRGQLTEEEALTHKSRNVLMRMVGGEGILSSDIYKTSAWLGQSDILLLGSDGALSVLPLAELTAMVNRNIRGGMTAFAADLYEAVHASGSEDNFTVLAQWVISD